MVPIGLWDTIKSGLAKVGRAASTAWNWVKDKASSAVKTVREWWSDTTTPVSQQLAESATKALKSGTQAATRAAQQAWDAQQRLRSAMAQQQADVRTRLVQQRAEQVKRAQQAQADATRVFNEVVGRIEGEKDRVSNLLQQKREEARSELDRARAVGVQFEDTLQELNRRALEEIVDQKDMITGLSQKTQDFMNEIAAEVNPRMKTVFSSDIFRTKLTEEERRVLEDPNTAFTIALAGINVGPGINKLLGRAPSAASRTAAARIRNLMTKKGIKTFVDNFAKDPKSFMKNIGKMNTVDRAKFMNTLRITPGGDDLAQAISRRNVNAWTQTLDAATRSKWQKLIPQSRKEWIALIGTMMAVYGAEFTATWFKKETPEMSLTAYQDAVRARDWKSVLRQYPFQRELQDAMRDNWVSRLLEDLPPFGEWSRRTWESQDAALEEGLARAMEAVAKGEVFLGTLHVIVSPFDANVQVNNKYMGKGTLRNLEVPPGPATIMVSRKGYNSQTQTVTIKPEQATTVNISLQPSPARTFKKWKKTTPKERQRLKTFKPRSYNYWQRSTPKQKTYYQDNYEKPRKEWTEPMRKQWEPWENEMEENGTITIQSTPAADIYMGGIDTGKTTPATFTLGPGTYDIRLETPGYESWIGKVFLKAGEDEVIQAELISRDPTERETTRGYVSVVTDPLGAWVFIDGVVSDYPTPTKLELEPGSYTFKIVKTGYRDLEFPVDVAAGETIRIDETLSPEVEENVWRVYVNSSPSGGKILVDGFFSGSWTDGFVDLLPGTYTISVQKTGFKEASQTVEVGQ